MKLLTCLFAVLVAATSSIGAEKDGAHLQPVDGYLSSYAHSHDYLIAVRTVLVRDAVQSPAMMVTLPSFRPEYVVFLEPHAGQSLVVSVTATTQIWSAKKRERVTVSRKEKLLGRDIADEIGTVFALATSQVHYPKEERSQLDGVSYHFSAFVKGTGVRAGRTWSRDSQTTCGRLIALGEHLHGYVRGEITAEKLQSEARDILGLLKKNT